CEYLGCKVNKSIRTCTRAKVCEFVPSELKEAQHSEVNADFDFYKINQPADSQTSKEAKTHAKYLAFVNFQCPYNFSTCTGKAQICRYGKKSDDDVPSYFIGCSAWAAGEKHTHHRIDENEIDIIILEKLFKGKSVTHFGKDLYTEIHASLNNLDKLRYLVNKAQQKQFPFGQGLLGIATEFWNGNKEFNGYLQEIGTFNDGSLIINAEQAIAWKNSEYFQIDMVFKRVHGEINEFEVNSYCENYNQSITYARVYTNGLSAEIYYRIFTSLWNYIKILTNESPTFYYIHNKGWKCILGDLDQVVKYIFIVRIEEIFEILKQIDNEKLEGWTKFYSTDWVIASLNPTFSNISIDIWYSTPHNTNISESSYARVNRYGTNLCLCIAIQKRTFHSKKIHDILGDSYTSRDQCIVARAKRSIQKNRKRQRTKSNIESNKIEQTNTDLNEIERKLAIREKEIALEE
ncbi:23182_t:CDS:10, partial [Gigaspora rosea]